MLLETRFCSNCGRLLPSLTPFALPQVEPGLQRVGPDDHAEVGEVDDSVDRRVVA
jgi:hypothetical protein